MKIALLAPAGAMHRYNGMFHKGLHYAPITLALLAALVPEDLNAEVKIYDETAEAIPLDLDADIIGITCITGTSSRCYNFADYFRSKGKTVILGGVHPSLMPEEAKQHADSIILGLGEINFPKALRDFKNGCLQPVYHQDPCTDISVIVTSTDVVSPLRSLGFLTLFVITNGLWWFKYLFQRMFLG